MCRAWHAAGAGLPELWEGLEADDQGYYATPKVTAPLLRWLDAWCATPQRPLLRLDLQMHRFVVEPGVAAGLVAVLRRSSTSLQHLDLWYSDSLGEQLLSGERAEESGFVAAIEALQQLTSLSIRGGPDLPSSTVLPASLQQLGYYCDELPQQITHLTRLERLRVWFSTPLPVSSVLLPSLRGLSMWCIEIPAHLIQLTQLEELELNG